MKIAAIYPACCAAMPLALMESAGRAPITEARLKREFLIGFARPRSDLFCHLVVIAQAIGRVSPVRSTQPARLCASNRHRVIVPEPSVVGQQGPDNACVLVRHRRYVLVTPLHQLPKPTASQEW